MRQMPRAIAICLIRDDRDRLLLMEGYDKVKQNYFYRPLGGAIEFGEHSSDTLVREFREEMNAELVDVRHFDTLENIFSCDGVPGHEIVQVYEGRLTDTTLYVTPRIPCVEDNGVRFDAVWMPLEAFGKDADIRLVPEGLMELIEVRKFA